jgi:SAM-dependent methyltransferase
MPIMRSEYYRNKLHGNLLKRCYDLAPPRIRQYLLAEMDYVLSRIQKHDRVLELGCGYGRVLQHLAAKAYSVAGIDISYPNIKCAVRMLKDYAHCRLFVMDAIQTGFREGAFDCVICIQNGISAFGVDQKTLIRESVRITRAGGLVFFSSYSPRIWPERLRWFELQASAGLVGEIDWRNTRPGVIVCRDGFTATTVAPGQFYDMSSDVSAETHVEEVDESSIFFVLTVHKKA